jgi:hypothetical protein
MARTSVLIMRNGSGTTFGLALQRLQQRLDF